MVQLNPAGTRVSVVKCQPYVYAAAYIQLYTSNWAVMYAFFRHPQQMYLESLEGLRQ